ncbi:uncharacterized protein ACRADG_000363 [Cochliomyia hominivorax]
MENIENNTKANEDNISQDVDDLKPAATSTPINQSIEDLAHDYKNIKKEVIKEEPDYNVTVGMAIMPEMIMYENMLPTSSTKKIISEVPSEMRKLATPLGTVEMTTDSQENKKPKYFTRRRGKRFAKKRMTRGRLSSMYLKVSRMNSFLTGDQEPVLFQDPSVLEFNDTEILQRNISYSSFHSLRDEFTDILDLTTESYKNLNNSVECEVKAETRDAETLTFVEKRNSCIQVNDEILVELQMDFIPKNIRSFLNLLKSSETNTKFFLNSSLFNMKMGQRWKTDEEFRKGLELMATLWPANSDDRSCMNLNSYEDFVSVLNCLDVFEEMFKPLKIVMLKEIETEINERLMIFHNQKMESEFYCTVYYPVERKNALEFEQLLKS